jgi:hypothetical protein
VNAEFERRLPGWTIVTGGFRHDPLDSSAATPLWKDQAGQLDLARIGPATETRYRLRFADLISVDVLVSERTIIEQPMAPDVPQSTRDHFLADQVLPRILGHLGQLVLHAGLVRIEDQAILLLGKSGSGKSTLAASFGQSGSALLGDDAVLVSWAKGRPRAAAVYPSLRLFPDSIGELIPDAVPTAAVAHYSPKLRIRVPLDQAGEAGPIPVRAIFVIGPNAPERDVVITPISTANSCMALIENSFVLDPTDTGRAPGRLQAASRLAAEVPAFDLCYPHAYSRLAAARAAIFGALDQAA